MEAITKININNAVLNLIQFDSLEEIIEGMINLDPEYFEKKYLEEIKKVRSRRFIRKGDIGAEVLFILKKRHKVEGKQVGMYRNLLRKELFLSGDKYVEYFQNEFLKVLNYHFNIRKIYGITVEEGIHEIENVAIKKFSNTEPASFTNALIAHTNVMDNNYIAIYSSEQKIKIIEKLGITSKHNRGSEKAAFIQYVIDLENEFFEIAYNDSIINDLCKQDSHERTISIESSDQTPIEKKFASETVALMNLYKRAKELLEDGVEIHSISKGLSSSDLKTILPLSTDYSTKDILSKVYSEKEAFNKSPFEAVLYQYFKEDREKLLSSVLEDKDLHDNEKFKDVLKNEFPDIDALNLSTSIKFLKNMIVFSKLKVNQEIIDKFEDFIFYFTVRDLAVTRSTTKNSDRKAVYTSEFYWHLQEVIDSIKMLTELGLRKTVDVKEYKKVSQEVKISHSNDHLHFMYFQYAKHNSQMPKEKNILRLAEGRDLVHEHIKNKFREIVSRETGI